MPTTRMRSRRQRRLLPPRRRRRSAPHLTHSRRTIMRLELCGGQAFRGNVGGIASQLKQHGHQRLAQRIRASARSRGAMAHPASQLAQDVPDALAGAPSLSDGSCAAPGAGECVSWCMTALCDDRQLRRCHARSSEVVERPLGAVPTGGASSVGDMKDGGGMRRLGLRPRRREGTIICQQGDLQHAGGDSDAHRSRCGCGAGIRCCPSHSWPEGHR